MPNLVLGLQGTPRSFKSSGGDAAFTPTSLANGAGRIAAQLDLGSGARPVLYEWRARTRAAANPVVGTTVRVYLITSDGSFTEGDFAGTDAAVASEDELRNGTMIGVIEADAASTTKDFVRAGLIEIRSRYIQVAYWNALGVALSATATDHEVKLTPISDEIQ